MPIRLASRGLARALLAAALALAPGAPARADALRVVASVPDLGDLATRLGAEAVEVTTLAKGPQDPHFVEPRPSFVRALHDADLLVVVGMELEAGWMPPLLQGARNPRLAPGGPGHLDASLAIVPLEVPEARVDRSRGDVHPFGNPHYLTDPLNGLRVAGALRDKLAELRPADGEGFRARYDDFAKQLLERLVGPVLAAARPPAEIAAAVEQGRLDRLAGEAGTPVGGWLGALGAGAPRKAVEDHRVWVYFAGRFGLELVATLEPLPGIAPTSRHLGDVVERMRSEGVSLVLAAPYFSPRPVEFVASRTGARIAPLAHQVGSRPGTDDYLAMVDYNVRQIAGGAP